MKSFSRILADANRMKPKQNSAISSLSPYLSDETLDDALQEAITDNEMPEDTRQAMIEVKDILKNLKSKQDKNGGKRLAVSNNIKGKNVLSKQDISESNYGKRLSVSTNVDGVNVQNAQNVYELNMDKEGDEGKSSKSNGKL